MSVFTLKEAEKLCKSALVKAQNYFGVWGSNLAAFRMFWLLKCGHTQPPKYCSMAILLTETFCSFGGDQIVFRKKLVYKSNLQN